MEEAFRGFADTERVKGVEVTAVQESRTGAREDLSFPAVTSNAYAVGGARRGGTKGLCEEWTRSPDVFQKDMEGAGVDAKSVDVLLETKDSFQHIVSVLERAGKILLKRYESRNPDADVKNLPRLITFVGSHGFVTEPWLKEVVAEYESVTGEKVPLELGYGEYFTVHFPSNLSDPVTLNFKGKTFPIKPELLERISHGERESS